MSVEFTARLICGYHVSCNEFNNLKEKFEDEIDSIYDDYMMTVNNYDKNSDMFFIVEDNVKTNHWKEVNHLVVVTPKVVSKIAKFQELFPERAEENPKYYLIEEVW